MLCGPLSNNQTETRDVDAGLNRREVRSPLDAVVPVDLLSVSQGPGGSCRRTDGAGATWQVRFRQQISTLAADLVN